MDEDELDDVCIPPKPTLRRSSQSSYTKPTKPKPSMNFSETVDVVVGENKQKFTIHKHRLCERSDFFKAACSDRWTRQVDRRLIELLDDDPYIFDFYLHCIYHDNVEVRLNEFELPCEQSIPSNEVFESRLFKTYILADKLCDPVSANLVMDQLVQAYRDWNFHLSEIGTTFVAYNTTSQSPLRRLAVDLIANEPYPENIRDICSTDAVPKQFISEVLIAKTELTYSGVSMALEDLWFNAFLDQKSKCHYHQHDELNPPSGDKCDRRKN